MRRKALLAWELGGGRGHVVTLAAVAKALRRRDFENFACLSQLEHAAEIAPFCKAVEQAPRLLSEAPKPGGIGSSRFGAWLGARGYQDSDAVRDQIERWRTVLADARPDILIVDSAPAALLAGRSLGIPVVRVGVPLTTPPSDMTHFPPILNEPAVPATDEQEEKLRTAVNEATASFGLPAMDRAPSMSAADDDIVASIGMLDCYRPWRKNRMVPPFTGGWSEPGERRREEVFIYLSMRERTDPVILAAIATLRLPARIVLAGNPEYGAKAAGYRDASVEEKPLPPGEIARRARVLVHAGNHGTSCLGIRAGLPQVTLPRYHEHVFDGRQIAAAGAGRTVEHGAWTVPNIQAAIRDVWDNSAFTERAETLARELASQFEDDPAETIADRIEAVIS
jgi:UDP:flavonoid glycosyltransferase YjiC (YdhE family)